jgi:hypothetical protein
MTYQFIENKNFTYCDPLGYLRNEKFVVYHMVDPTDNQIRYIGQTTNGMKRIVNHFTPFAMRSRTHKNSWLKSLKIKGVKPIVLIAHKADSFEQLNELEKSQIAVFKKCVNLTNLCDGGSTKKLLEPKPKSSFLKWAKKIAKPRGNGTPPIAVKDQHGTVYQSLSIAARQIGTTSGNIRKHLNGKHSHIKGYKFKEIH